MIIIERLKLGPTTDLYLLLAQRAPDTSVPGRTIETRTKETIDRDQEEFLLEPRYG
jgi:hypothetical protein